MQGFWKGNKYIEPISNDNSYYINKKIKNELFTKKKKTQFLNPERLLNWLQMSRDMTKPTNDTCAVQRLRSAWAFAQSDQSLGGPHEEILDP